MGASELSFTEGSPFQLNALRYARNARREKVTYFGNGNSCLCCCHVEIILPVHLTLLA